MVKRGLSELIFERVAGSNQDFAGRLPYPMRPTNGLFGICKRVLICETNELLEISQKFPSFLIIELDSFQPFRIQVKAIRQVGLNT